MITCDPVAFCFIFICIDPIIYKTKINIIREWNLIRTNAINSAKEIKKDTSTDHSFEIKAIGINQNHQPFIVTKH